MRRIWFVWVARGVWLRRETNAGEDYGYALKLMERPTKGRKGKALEWAMGNKPCL